MSQRLRTIVADDSQALMSCLHSLMEEMFPQIEFHLVKSVFECPVGMMEDEITWSVKTREAKQIHEIRKLARCFMRGVEAKESEALNV